MFDYEEDYYEQGPLDEIYADAMGKMKEMLSDDLKQHIEQVKSTDVKLKGREEALREKENKLSGRERQLEYNEKQLERDFVREKFSTLLKPLLTPCFEVTYKSIKKDKCSKCDDDKMVIFRNGNDELKQRCSCDSYVNAYYPIERSVIDITSISLGEKGRDYKPLMMTVNYSREEYNEADYCSWKNESRSIKEVFDEETDPKDTYKVCYSSLEECKKYCDFKNRKNGTLTLAKNMHHKKGK